MSSSINMTTTKGSLQATEVEVLEKKGLVIRQSEHESGWLCPFKNCGVLSSNLNDLNYHFICLHNTRPYACDHEDCTWAFPSKSKLDRHKQFVHSSEKTFLCDYEGCGKTFKNNSNLKHHKKLTHESEPKFICSYGDCGAAFHTQKSLDFHLPEHEDAVPGYPCTEPQCGKSFFTRNALCSHKRRHEYNDGDLRCKLCGKEFEAPCRLRSHMQGHENNRPYPCPEIGCQWSFPSQSKLARHMDKHKQNRRYRCSTDNCFKAFLRMEHLSDHMKTHSKVKVYRCPVKMCDAVFDARKLVQPHVAQMHPKPAKTAPPVPVAESTDIPSSHSLPVTPVKSSSSDEAFMSDVASSPISDVSSPTRGLFQGSARTSLTYRDLVQLRLNKRDEPPLLPSLDEHNRNHSTAIGSIYGEKANVVDVAGQCEIEQDSAPDRPLVDSLGISDLESRDILQSDTPAHAVQQDLMLSGANLNDSSSLILQEELLTQEYFLLLESTNRLSDFEPSTINLRDLE